MSSPLFCWLVVEMFIAVLGDMYLGIILSVLKGVNTRGIVSLTLPPNSLISKKLSSSSLPSLEAPMAAIPLISRVSAPLKIFLIFKPGVTEKPMVCILLCDTSTSRLSAYFFLGSRYLIFEM